MLRLKDIGRARRFAGADALAVLCACASLIAWAAQPADAGAADAGRLQLAQLQTRHPDDGNSAPAAEQGVRQPAPGATQAPASAPTGPGHNRKAKACWTGRYGCAKERDTSLDIDRDQFSNANTNAASAGAMSNSMGGSGMGRGP